MENINITGLHVELGEALQQYVRDRINERVQKYFEHPTRAEVKFDKHGNLFHAEILVNDGTGTGEKSVSKAHADGTDVYKTFDSCLEKLAWQLNKYKHKLHDLHRRRLSAEKFNIAAMDRVINYEESDDDASSGAVVDANAAEPVVIAEMKTEIERLSVKDAVMRLELMHLNALAFINDGSGRINFIYTRPDGNISWIDAEKLTVSE